jgi:hypothetical protein
VALADGSSIGAAPLSQLLLSFFDEPIETTGLNVSDKLTVGTEQIVRASSERFERATVVALDPIVLLVAPN